MTLFPDGLVALATAVLESCRKAGLKVATAESCTGGLICAVLTEIPGSSAVVERGFVTYSNAAKTEVLSVPEELLQIHGAVSEPVARAMAAGALHRCPGVAVAVGVTGIAGPGEGTPDRPVGLVHLAAVRHNVGLLSAAQAEHTLHQRLLFPGNRTEVRLATVAAALAMLMALAVPVGRS